MSESHEFDLDTAISADLDGELALYCTELDIPLSTARAELDTPTARARRAELAATRLALTPVEPLDELTRRRLLAGATADGGRARSSDVSGPHRRRWWPALAATGAAAALIIGVLAVSGGGGSDSAAKAGSSAAKQTPHGNLGNVGRLNQQQIDELVGGAKPTAPPSAKSADAAAGRGSESQSSLSAAPGFAQSTAAATPQQIAACAGQYGAQGTIRFQASGTFQGRSAVILGVDTDRRTIVFVVASDNCNEVLYSASR